MKIVRLAGLVLVAAITVGLVTVSAASAALLLNPGTGTFTALTGTTTFSANNGGFELTCEKSLDPGVIDNPHLILIVIHLLGCSGGESGSTCSIKSVGAPAPELILTATLHGILGLILPNIPGLLLLPIASNIWETLVGPCFPTTKVTGNQTAELSPIGVLQITGKVTFGANVGTHFVASLGGLTLAKLTEFSTPLNEAGSATIDWAQLTEVT